MKEAIIQKSAFNSSTSSCEIFQGGTDYFARYLQMIDQAQHTLHLQVYIFNEDATGKAVQEALIKASLRGVQVFLVVDGVGSRHIKGDFLNRFINAGITIHFFSKIHFSFPLRIGRRLHHKLLVADHQKAMVGGINIANRYLGKETKLPWLDFAVYLEGTICIKLHNLAVGILNKRNFKKTNLGDWWKKEKRAPILKIEVKVNDFYKGKLEIRRGYHKAIRLAENTLIIFAGYFLPKYNMLRLLEKAAERGVAVSLVLPKKTDAYFYNAAVKVLCEKLLDKGIKIYEYPLAIMHAKVAVVDNQWCTIGSYNLNDLSDLLSVELNIEISDSLIVSNFQTQLDTIIKNDCIELLQADLSKASRFYKWRWRIYYLGIIQSIRLLHWLTIKEEKNRLE